MQKIRCSKCGRTYYSADELKIVEEDRGEFWGMPAFETMYYCWCGTDRYLEDYDDDETDDEMED